MGQSRVFSRAETLATFAATSHDTVSLAYTGKGDRSGGVQDEKLSAC